MYGLTCADLVIDIAVIYWLVGLDREKLSRGLQNVFMTEVTVFPYLDQPRLVSNIFWVFLN